MNILRTVLTISNYFFIVLLGSLQFLDQDWIKATAEVSVGRSLFYAFIYENRLIISFLLGIGIVVFGVIKDLILPRVLTKRYRQIILETIVDELFSSDKRNVRVTLFLDATRTRIILIYLRKNLFGFFRSIRSFKKLRENVSEWYKSLPPLPKVVESKYILVNQRVATENRNSRTFSGTQLSQVMIVKG